MTKWIKENWLLILGILIILIAAYAAYNLKYIYQKQFTTIFPKSEKNRAEWGVLGDFFGGFLNPVFSFLGLIFLLATLFLNQKELELSRNEFRSSAEALNAQAETLEKQRFEDTFFALLNQFNLLMEKSNIADDVFWEIVFSGADGATYNLKEAKKSLLKSSLNQNFRVLYQLLKFIATNCPESNIRGRFSSETLDSNCTQSEKLYSNIVRAFLAENFYFLLAINCYCQEQDDKFIEYKKLVERYEFFEHIQKPVPSIDFTDGWVDNGREVSALNKIIEAIAEHFDRRSFGNNSYIKELNRD